MREKILQIRDRIDNMELRQRILLLVAGLVLLFSVADTLALQPALKQQKASKQAIQDIELKMDVLRQRSGMASENPGDSEYRQLLDTLAGLEREVEAKAGSMLGPEQAIKVLEQLLAEEQGLTLNEATSTVLAPDGEEPDAASGTDGMMLNRYRVSLQLEGSYLATLRYLRALEELPWHFYWEGIDYEVREYPQAQVNLHLYTLGYPQESTL